MTKYICKCGNSKDLEKATITLVNGKWETKEALCEVCGLYMDSKPKEGMPGLIRTENSLSKNRTK